MGYKGRAHDTWRTELSAGLVKFDGENTRVVFKIGVRRKDRPVSSESDRANQSVHYGYRGAFARALIAGLSGSFVVRRINGDVRKGAKKRAKFFKLSSGTNTGQDFLTDQAN